MQGSISRTFLVWELVIATLDMMGITMKERYYKCMGCDDNVVDVRNSLPRKVLAGQLGSNKEGLGSAVPRTPAHAPEIIGIVFQCLVVCRNSQRSQETSVR